MRIYIIILLIFLMSPSQGILRKFPDFTERWYQGVDNTAIGMTNEPTHNYFGINNVTPSCELDVVGTISANYIVTPLISANVVVSNTTEIVTLNATRLICTSSARVGAVDGATYTTPKATSLNVGTIRYFLITGNQSSWFQICMQSGETTYAWYTIKFYNWSR